MGRARHVDVVRTWHRRPGVLTERALRTMADLLGMGVTPVAEMAPAVRAMVMAYLHQVMFHEMPRDRLGIRNTRELVTLGLVSDKIRRGEVAAALDVCIQRIKAVERAAVDGNWDAAKWYELIPTGEALLTPREESLAAHKIETAEQKLKAARNGKSS